MSHTLLIADRDRDLVAELAHEFAADGYTTLTAKAASAVVMQLEHSRPDLVVLGDLANPNEGTELVRWARAAREPFTTADPTTPLVRLSGDAGQLALLRAFDAGADDYLRKPVSYLELRARIRAVIARATGQRVPAIRRVGALEIDTDGRCAAYAGQPLQLSRLEFQLLAQLGERPGRVHSKQALLREIWGYQTDGATRTIDAHACRLRKKLAQAGAIDLIVNHRGHGYALTATGGDTDQPA